MHSSENKNPVQGQGYPGKHDKHKTGLPKAPPMQKDNPTDPPGVNMPSEREMTPPQFG